MNEVGSYVICTFRDLRLLCGRFLIRHNGLDYGSTSNSRLCSPTTSYNTLEVFLALVPKWYINQDNLEFLTLLGCHITSNGDVGFPPHYHMSDPGSLLWIAPDKASRSLSNRLNNLRAVAAGVSSVESKNADEIEIPEDQ